MAEEKQQPAIGATELSHELAANGDAVVVDKIGTDADRHDMYRMGKVQQMQVKTCLVSTISWVLSIAVAAHLQSVPNVQL